MKKLMSLLLSVVLVFFIHSNVLAVPNYNTLEDIAKNIIKEEIYIDEYGSNVYSYSCIDKFVEYVHENMDYITEHELSIFLMQYTQQDYAGLPEEEITNILKYDNISTVIQYIGIGETGEPEVSSFCVAPLASWDSSDGYMQITTSYSLISTNNGEKHFEVWARATWLKYPAVCIRDTFTLGTNATFDDGYIEYGSVSQRFMCNVCSNYTIRTRYVTPSRTTDDDLDLTYSNYVPVLQFTPLSPRCDHCSGGSVTDNYFSTYIRYGIITTGSANIQAGYAHRKLGIGNIGVSISATGTPSFSSSVTTISSYIARPVTVS